jgi:signal peptidase I
MKKKYSSWAHEWTNTIIWAVLVAIIFRSFLFEPFNIPSGSMIPTLHVGDHIFVTKWSYGYSRNSFPFGSWKLWNGRFLSSEPDYGDVIVFRKPNDTVDFVKRMIGKPGDTIQMIGGRLYINGKMMERKNPKPYIIANLPKSIRAAGYSIMEPDGPLVIKGNRVFKNNELAKFNYTIQYKSDYICNQGPWECGVMSGTEWTEVLPNGRVHQIVELSDDGPMDNTRLFKVPAEHYFMVGDDRDMSNDSRADVGFVPRDNLLGKVWFIFYSHNYYAPFLMAWTWNNKIRWDRLGMAVK